MADALPNLPDRVIRKAEFVLTELHIEAKMRARNALKAIQ